MRRRMIAAATLTAVGLLSALPAGADLAHPAVVSPDPVDTTPHVLDGSVRAIAVVGRTVVVGGDFSEVTDARGTSQYRRHGLFAYDLVTGAVLRFAPSVDGSVYALAAGPNGSVYVGGAFQSVNGTAQRGLTQLSLATGARVPGFTASINYGDVRSLVSNGPWLYAGGTFTKIGGAYRTALARLSGTTGAADPAFDLGLAAPTLSRAKVEDLTVSPDGSRLVAIGAIQEAGGQYRAQLVMADTPAGAPARVADWYTNAYTPPCRAGFETYLRGVDFSPDGAYFVVVTTGRTTGANLTCDTAIRFETAGRGLHNPTWVNHTGGDSLYTVSVTGAAVYVGGHQRWMNNAHGFEAAGPGAVSRQGIAALNPTTGLANEWDPTRDRGIGVKAMVATPNGLILGSDTERLGREYHGRLGMFPLR
ncbi:MAG TPA: PKD domain containing protein [Micromonosporaceae bacterium]|nr:PKD domain containing protein [Micromonosporaceae bacterium]